MHKALFLTIRGIFLLSLIFQLCSCKNAPRVYNGYIDADLTYLSSNYPGRLISLLVSRGQTVQKNQLLFKLEQTNERYSIKMSQLNQKSLFAQRQEIIDQINYNEINYRRALRMKKQDAASQNDVDVAIKDLNVLKNQLKDIDVQLKRNLVNTADKTWQAQRKENQAIDYGIIFDTYFTQGEYVQAGQPVISLVTQKNIKVVFFVSENELSKVFLHAKVNISSDGTPKLASGEISYIANIAQYTPPIIYSREDRQALIFRVEARLENPNLEQVHLGQPVSLEIVS